MSAQPESPSPAPEEDVDEQATAESPVTEPLPGADPPDGDESAPAPAEEPPAAAEEPHAPAAAEEPHAPAEEPHALAEEPHAFEPPPPPPPGASSSPSAPAAQRPEVAIGAAFAGGFLLALVLKRLAR